MGDLLLVKRAIKRDKESFGCLINNYKIQMYKIAFLYTKNEDDALEIIDESVYKSYKNISKLKNPEFFKTWLIRIVINECKNYMKKQSKIVPQEDDKYFEGPMESIEENVNLEYLYNLLDDLTQNQRTAIILRYYQDMKISKVAEIMDIPENTVKTHIRRGLNNLRVLIKEDELYVQ